MKNVAGNSLRFWKESAVYFRNEKDKSKTVEEFLDNFELLKVAREQVRRHEKRILHVVVIVVVLLAVSGCETLQGMAADVHHITRPKLVEK